ncbi:DUF1750-domain-containing protein [Polyplosphaeria fusca]|uniref:DUF1750-domain-containing protein n=1 Tax=Polyplosphaeria fusca TaxID=682080 RepID=A0A9P4R1M1_9PLEO|nr:DUF1750-domain-containing protein [Polyplosphaeria fusca]
MNQYSNVADPSGLVPDTLLPHVHLVSSYRFPSLPNLQPVKALEFLLNGPQIVKDTSPVAWTYFPTPPPDHTVLMTWQPPRLGTKFASDGLVFADPEMAYESEIQGFLVQMLMHRSGYIYPGEPYTMHARYRYRVLRGPPGQFDPNLWVVYYMSSPMDARVPATSVQLLPEIQMTIRARSQIEATGQLMRKEFMLRDRANWPNVEFGNQRMAGQQRVPPYYNPMQGYMGMQQPQPGRPVGQPPNKRQRQQPPAGRVGPAATPLVDQHALLDEEENNTQDAFDFLTPREISQSRYQQHHEWMEEIFSSPYAVGRILPIDLGLGLMGELAPLTTDILDAPAGDHPPPSGKPKDDKIYEVKSYYKLEPEQLKEFEKRVMEYTKAEEAELEAMRSAHAKKMADLKRSRTYIKAERRLRDAARIAGNSDSARSPEGLEQDAASSDALNTVVRDLEKTLGVNFDAKKNVVCVEKGGFIEEQPAPPPPPKLQQVNGNGAVPSNAPSMDTGSNSLLDDAALDVENSAASLLDQYGSNSLTGTPGASLSVPQLSQPPSQSQSAVATPSGMVGDGGQISSFDDANLQATSDGNDLLDLDVEMSGMTNVDDKGEGDWVMVNETHTEQQTGAGEQPSNPTDTPVDLGEPSAVPTSGVDTENTASMFDTADFGSFDNLDTAGDALAEYTNADDNMGLDLVDDSAFGDAFHGTEMHHGDSGVDGDNS